MIVRLKSLWTQKNKPLSAILSVLCFLILSACKEEVSIVDKTPNPSVLKWEKSWINCDSKHPVELSLKVYEAGVLPVGEFYRSDEQLKEAKLLADLTWNLNANTENAKFEENGVRGAVEMVLEEGGEYSDVKLELEINSLFGFYLKQLHVADFNAKYYCENGSEGKVYVCVYKLKKLDWNLEPKKKAVLKTPERGEEMHPQRKAKLAPIVLPDLEKILPNHKSKAAKVSLRKYPMASMPEMYNSNDRFPILDAAMKDNLNSSLGVLKSDKVIDLRPLFESIITSDEQWVYYNETQGEILANADSYLDASLKYYTYKKHQASLMFVRVSAQWLLVDAKASTSIANIKSLDQLGKVKRLSSFSKTLISGYLYKMKSAETAVNIEAFLDDTGRHANVSMMLEASGNRTVENTATLLLGQEQVFHYGLTTANEPHLKSVLLIKAELLDRKGNEIKVDQTMDLTKYVPEIANEERGGDPFSEDLRELYFARFKVPGDLDMLMSPDPECPFDDERIRAVSGATLVTTPQHPFFNENDVVIDVSELFVKSGIPLPRPCCALFVKNREELFVIAEENSLDLFESLVTWGGHTPMSIRASLTLFEVDSRKNTDELWNAKLIGLSNPKVLSSGGFISRSGEKVSADLGKSDVSIESIIGDDGYMIQQNYNIYLNTQLVKLEKQLEALVKDGATSYIEIENNGNRSIVMQVDVVQDRVDGHYISRSPSFFWSFKH